MNRISLKRMKLYGYTGCLPEEKKNGQYFVIDVDMMMRSIPGALTDDLEGTVNYAEVFEKVKRIVSESRFNLIEHLAFEIGRALISEYDLVNEVSVLVRKPDAPVAGDFECMETKINVRRRNAVIGFGGNMGDREDIIREALSLIGANPAIDILKVSSLYETEPVGYADQDDFLNGCLLISTYLEPLELLHFLQDIENKLHRVRTIKNGPRTIDLDLLLMDGIRMDTKELILPHPRMYERAFVLVPLKEIGLYDGVIPDGKSVRLYGTISN